MSLLPQCFSCRNFQGINPEIGFVCAAFFDKPIPIEIMARATDHRKPFWGDHGVRYEPEPLMTAADTYTESQHRRDEGGRFSTSTTETHGLSSQASGRTGQTEYEAGYGSKPKEPQMPRAPWGRDGLATDPPVSEKQRRAMFAAAAGHSNLGIPQSVGEEFANADPGGHLPEQAAKDMKRSDWRNLIHGMLKFFAEEAEEPEHGQDAAPKGRAASVAFVTKDGQCLFVKRGKDEENWPNTWALPGGKADGEEKALDCAIREAREEIGEDCGFDGIKTLDERVTPYGWHHTTFAVPVKDAFEPKLNGEHSQHIWAPVTAPPDPLHPGVKATLDAILGAKPPAAADAPANPSGKLSEKTREEVESTQTREEMPTDAFLIPGERKYPVKEKREGKWQYTRNLLLAAARRARMQGRGDLATRADAIRKREFDGEAEGENEDRGQPRQAHDRALSDYDWKTRQPRRLIPRQWVPGMALDRALHDAGGDKRTYDSDGRLHVDDATISKAVVNPYWGKEINEVMKGESGWKMLDPEKKYHLLRDPEELKKGAKTFNGVPILRDHVAMTAATHNPDLVIGSTGTDAKFVGDDLKNSLVFWPKSAIDKIEDGEEKELSCAYKYKADMKPGVFKGTSYDGVMRNIIGNHVALVKKGRVGSEAAV